VTLWADGDETKAQVKVAVMRILVSLSSAISALLLRINTMTAERTAQLIEVSYLDP
jgi:hypothetical protein